MGLKDTDALVSTFYYVWLASHSKSRFHSSDVFPPNKIRARFCVFFPTINLGHHGVDLLIHLRLSFSQDIGSCRSF